MILRHNPDEADLPFCGFFCEDEELMGKLGTAILEGDYVIHFTGTEVRRVRPISPALRLVPESLTTEVQQDA